MSDRIMRPTEGLRFVERVLPGENDKSQTIRVLQQQWKDIFLGGTEWRDVPCIPEPTVRAAGGDA